MHISMLVFYLALFVCRSQVSSCIKYSKSVPFLAKYVTAYTCVDLLNHFTAWDLLRIDVYGFKAFCKWFLHAYPGYFVSPLRISGSAVESIFSQYKHIAGGKLDSVNYSNSRCAHLVQQCVATHHSGKHCRDESASFIELPLVKKQYNKAQKPL